jgi:hypothetical protein
VTFNRKYLKLPLSLRNVPGRCIGVLEVSMLNLSSNRILMVTFRSEGGAIGAGMDYSSMRTVACRNMAEERNVQPLPETEPRRRLVISHFSDN